MIRRKRYVSKILNSAFTLGFILFLGVSPINSNANENKDTNIPVQKAIVSLKLDQTTNINYNSVKDDDISYYSKDLKVASIDSEGNITANMIGSTTIVGQDDDGDISETIVIVYRTLLDPLGEIEEPRYTLKDGIYVNESAEKTDEALLMFTGDLMSQGRQQLAAKTEDGTYDFNESFSMVKDIFAQGDFVVGNLETLLSNTSPYMSEEKALGGQPHCNAPSTYLDALKYAGFDALVNSNNHITDNGERGIIQTLDLLEKYKFAYTGSFRNKDEQRFIIADINGIKVGIMSYSEKFNGKDVYLDEDVRETMINRYTKEALEKDVKDAKEMGAEYIIAYNHWGVEYTNEYNEKQEISATEMANAGVDLILGSHPHALQTSEIINTEDGREVQVIYSLGNFISHMYRPISNDTYILTVTLKRAEDGSVYMADEGYIPCYVYEEYNNIPYLVVPISKDFNGGIEDQGLNESIARIRSVVNGTIPEVTSYDELIN